MEPEAQGSVGILPSNFGQGIRYLRSVEERERERWEAQRDWLLQRVREARVDGLEATVCQVLEAAMRYGAERSEPLMAQRCVKWAEEMLSPPGWAMTCVGDPKKGQFQRALLPHVQRKINSSLTQAGAPPAFGDILEGGF